MNFIIGNKAVVLIHDTIDNEMSKEISSFIYGLEFMDEVTDLEVSINSPGGSVMAGFSIYSAIKNSTKKTNTTVEFLSASIATVVMFATDTLALNDFSNVMVHNPFGGSEKVLKNVKDSIMAVYSDKFGKNVSKLMDKETWFNSTELNKLGIIDNVIYSNKKEEVLNFSENNISEIMQVSNEIVKNKFDSMLENDENVENVENVENTEVENIEKTEINEVETTEEEVTENKNEEVSNENEEEVSNEVSETEEETEEEVINEEEIVEVPEEMEVENAVNIDDLLKENQTLKEENEEMKNQLGIISETKIKEEKLEVLENSAIENSEYDKWMDLDLDVIKNLTSTIKKDVKTPKISFNDNKELKFSELTNEEKIDLKENDPSLYSKLFFENK